MTNLSALQISYINALLNQHECCYDRDKHQNQHVNLKEASILDLAYRLNCNIL